MALNAQTFKLLRFDEDYSYLRTDSSRTFYEKLKYTPLTVKKSVYVSLGGELRYEYAFKNNEDWENNGGGRDQSFLQRYVLLADFHAGNRFRLYAQVNSCIENGSKYGAGPADEDKLAVQNFFAEYRIRGKRAKNLALRLGRQEIDYGSGRLISVREGTNVRLYFTGGKLTYSSPRFSVDGFVMMADNVRPGVFDNTSSKEANLWGAYSYLVVPKGGNFDFYYLGIRRDNASFEEGTAKEVRHTVASRYWKYGNGFTYNLEAAYQFGRFGRGNISAWTTAIEVGYTFSNSRLKPSVNLRNDYISGDKNAGDGDLETFNPLFPKGGYFGFNPRIGPANLVDLHPYASVSFTDKLSMQADVVFNWRYSLNDGIYRPSGSFNLPGSASNERYIGTAYLLSAEYRFNKYTSFSCGAQYFDTGNFIRDIGANPPNSNFFNAQFTFKF
ncbi:alginate export family protein [Hufsiella arboris]|nr:alginate export family protein [Hufsiella arboris]